MLKKKMLRDIKLNLSQFITIFLMVFIGIMAFCGIESFINGMTDTAVRFYKENNLQDLNLMGISFTKDNLNTIKEMKYVNDAERKLTLNATTDDDKTLALSFIETNNISKFYVVSGKKFNYETKGIWLDNFYATRNNIKVGDTITIKYDGYTFKEKVIGTVNIPDHIYDIKDESELFSDHKDFGFAYLSSKELEGYIKYSFMKENNLSENDLKKMQFNYQDYVPFNNIMVDVDKKNNVSKVKDNIEDEIENALGIIKIEDSLSYSTYEGEINEGKTYIGVFSGLFIFIAMLSVITTMRRVVKKQKIEIGTLKALGFSDKKVIFHYISYGFFVSLLASIVGLVVGYFGIGNIFINMEMSFFELPNGAPVLKITSFICAILVILGVCLVTYLSCKSELNKMPADTLRNEIPKVKKGSLNITTKGIFKKLSFSIKWNIRDIFRNKIRTITAIAGISGCTMLIVCAFGMLNTINHFIDLQFHDLYNFKYKLSIKEGISDNQLKTLLDNYGDSTSQTYLIEIKDKDGNKESNNVFINDSNNCVRFKDNKDNFIKLDKNYGVYVTYKFAEVNNYKIGDIIEWHLVGSNEYYKSKIVGFNKDPQNQNMTITREYYESLGNKYTPDSLYTNSNLEKVKEIENIEIIQDLNSLENGMNNMLSTMKNMIVLIIGIAILLGSVIIYNMGILSYTEKQYQFATLKVLGFSDSKVKKIFIQQNNIITVISIILGLPLGYFLTDWLFKTAISETYDFGASINMSSYLIALIGTFIVSYLVSLYLSKKITKIDMVSSLKGNE